MRLADLKAAINMWHWCSMVSISAFQAEGAGSSPVCHSISGCTPVGRRRDLGVPWRYPGQVMAKRRKALQHLRLRGLSPVAEGGTKADLTTGMTTDRKNFDFPSRRDIMAEIEYPGVAKLVSRLIWVQETGRSSRPTRTKIPLKSTISEGFFLFFVYCGAGGEIINNGI